MSDTNILAIKSESLSEEQTSEVVMTRVMLWIADRLTTTQKNNGWLGTGNYVGWSELRNKAQKRYEGDYNDRMTGDKFSQLYRVCNNTMHMPAAVIDKASASTNEKLLNSDPLAEIAVKSQDEGEKKVVGWMGKLFTAALKKANFQKVGRKAIKQHDKTGEAVLRVNKPGKEYSEQKQGKVWCDAAGNPILSRGFPIHENAVWEMTKAVAGQDHLKTDPKITKSVPESPPETDPAKVPFIAVKLSDTVQKWEVTGTRYALHIGKSSWMDFWCDLDEDDIHKAVANHFTFEWDWDVLIKYLGDREIPEQLKTWYDGLKHRNESWQTRQDSMQPNQQQGENPKASPNAGDGAGKIKMCESWFRFDLGDDGKTQELYLLWDVTECQPIVMETMEKVSPTKTRPAAVVRRFPCEDRWYGMGYFQILAWASEFIDQMLSRINVRETSSGRCTFAKRNSMPEVMAGKPFTLNSGHVWDYTGEKPPLVHVEIPAMSEGVWEMMKHVEQAASLASGTMTPGDAAATSFTQGKNTAAAAEILNQATELLATDALQEPKEGLEDVLRLAFVAYFDPETFDFEEACETITGEEVQAVLDYVTSRGVNHLLQHVNLLLTKVRSKAQLAANQQAWQLMFGARSFVDVLAEFGHIPDVVKVAKKLMVGMLSSLDVDDSDDITEIEVPQPAFNPTNGQQQPLRAAA